MNSTSSSFGTYYRSLERSEINKREIPGFVHEVDENCTPIGYYTACSGNSLPAKNYHYTLRSRQEERDSQRFLRVANRGRHTPRTCTVLLQRKCPVSKAVPITDHVTIM
jgi:hypothetical protein